MFKTFIVVSLIIIINSLYFNPGYSNAYYIVLINNHYSYSEKYNIIFLNKYNYTMSVELNYPNSSVNIYYDNISYNASFSILNILNLNVNGPFPEINSTIINDIENNSPNVIKGIFSIYSPTYKWRIVETNTYIGKQNSLLFILSIQNSMKYYIKYYANFSLSNGLLLNENITKYSDGNFSNKSIILSMTNLFKGNFNIFDDLIVFVVIISFVILISKTIQRFLKDRIN